mmetsp:Transcript_9816/g.13832  ORF Transcript_9816/g.13832 Transcript_9816/m.13832 type:complete len:114 (+) Transcript_9816:110-451(+)
MNAKPTQQNCKSQGGNSAHAHAFLFYIITRMPISTINSALSFTALHYSVPAQEDVPSNVTLQPPLSSACGLEHGLYEKRVVLSRIGQHRQQQHPPLQFLRRYNLSECPRDVRL